MGSALAIDAQRLFFNERGNVKKLSKLQKAILQMAWCNRQAHPDRGAAYGCDLFTTQILIEFYGFPTNRSEEGHWLKGGQNFNVSEIGEQQYRAGRAAVSRALARLEDRGLVVRVQGEYRNWSGVNLTEEGIALVSSEGSP